MSKPLKQSDCQISTEISEKLFNQFQEQFIARIWRKTQEQINIKLTAVIYHQLMDPLYRELKSRYE
jgi:hypothetical protein